MRACGVFLLWAATAVALPAQTFTTLYSFCSQANCTDGSFPYAGLVQSTDGNFYGTTKEGGTNDNSPCDGGNVLGCGTVFKITPGGKLNTLYSFCSQGGSSCTDGNGPQAALIQATDGKFYGTTVSGGAYVQGTIFKITSNGKLITLHSFCSQGGPFCADGANPEGALIQATNGKFYGTTDYGGVNNSYCNNGFSGTCGTVFSVTASGKLTTLYSFTGYPSGGANPVDGLVQGTRGGFYGTTPEGGASNEGIVFKISPNGTLKMLLSFNYTDGAYPQAGLVQGTDGNFYGTTYGGGDNNDSCYEGCGTVFKITPSGRLTTLYSFPDSCTYGCMPQAGLVQGTDGKFYGTTQYGGAHNNAGTVFSITPGGKLITLYNFCSKANCADGGNPYAGLVQGTNGKFYGTTTGGGSTNNCISANGCGTVFSLSVGLGPFVKTQPASGAVGTAVMILGTGLTDATNVRFNGLEAKFTVVSGSEITTTVPNGATTGPVRVITPSGKLQSNVPFRVK
jgi:uncharacterized repeat protein (TIGR03803 family)